MALLNISEIPSLEFGSTTSYDLDTSLFNENIFKMCTGCATFAYDFADIYCECGQKFTYVDVSDIEALKTWLNSPVMKETQKDICVEDMPSLPSETQEIEWEDHWEFHIPDSELILDTFEEDDGYDCGCDCDCDSVS